MTDDRTSGSDAVQVPTGTQTLARGLAVIQAVESGATDLRAIVEHTGIGRSTTHRLIQLLVREGYLRSVPEHAYALGPKLIELGFRALEENPISGVAAPVLQDLADQVHDTVHLAVEDDEQVLYLAKLPGTRGAEMRSRIGYRMPLTRTGIGKALLLDSPDRWGSLYEREQPVDPPVGDVEPPDTAVFLARMRRYAKRGVSLDLEENEPGIRCVATPIRDGSGAIVAAISVSATRPYMPEERLEGLGTVVVRAARRISEALGYSRG